MMRMKRKPFDAQKRKRIERAVRMGNVRQILNDLKIPYEERKTGDLWFKCVNPMHKERDASAHICCMRTSHKHGVWHCFGCKDAGNIITLVRDWLQISYWEALNWVEARIYEDDVSPVRQEERKVTPTLPPKFEFYEDMDEWNPPYLEYLFNRGITWEQIVRHRIGYCDSGKYKQRVIVPVYLNGILQTWVGRHIWGGKRVTSCHGGNVGLFGSELALPSRGPSILSEGWADALAIERLDYINSMGCQTNHLHPEQFQFIKRFEFTIVVPDGDSGGKKFIDSLAPYVDQHEFLIAEIPTGTDPAKLILQEYGGVQLEAAIQEAKEWNPILEDRVLEFEF